MRYYSNAGPQGGLKYSDGWYAVGVHESPTSTMPIGMALGIGPDDNGYARFRLVIGGQGIAGEWYLVDRVFRPIDRS